MVLIQRLHLSVLLVLLTAAAWGQAPVITSPLSADGIVGKPFVYQIVATNATGYGADGLPSGLSLNPGGGLISGTPLVVGTYGVTITATNDSGPATAILTIAILPASVTATTNLLFAEGFESNFPAAWQVGDANAADGLCYWGSVSSPCAGVDASEGARMAYCAAVNYAGSSDAPLYRKNMQAYLQRAFDLAGNSAVTLKFQSYVAGIETGFDTCRVRVSSNGGGSWDEVWSASRVDGDWTSETVPLNRYAGQTSVWVRFEFDSDETRDSTGWFLDDVQLLGAAGDRFDNAATIAVGTDYAGTVSSAASADRDVVRVALRRGYRYVITATPGTLTDPRMWLYGVDREQIAYNDDGRNMGLGSRIQYTCEESGDYFVQVGGADGGTGGYTLLVAEQPVVADIEALDVVLELPDGDPRGQPPQALRYTLRNNGPFSLDNDENYDYQVDLYLSSDGTHAGTGVLIGSETIQLALANSETVTMDATINELANFTIPDSAVTGAEWRVWLHVQPLAGSPGDPRSANDWVAGGIVPSSRMILAGKVVKSGASAGATNVPLVLCSDSGMVVTVTYTDGNGNYRVTVPCGWSGTLTPSNGAAGGVFVPAQRAFTNVTADQAAQDFAWGAVRTIRGRITYPRSTNGVAGIGVTFSGGAGVAVTDANGDYSREVIEGWRGTATPADTNPMKGGFSPASRSYGKLKKDMTGQNYTWLPPPVISGTVTAKGSRNGVTNVVVVFSDLGPVSTGTDGVYSNTVPYNWTGSVSAQTNGLGGSFAPSRRTFSRVTSNRTRQNFTWNAPRPLPSVAAAPKTAVMAVVPAPRRLLHTTGTIHWRGADACQARRSPWLLRVVLRDGEVRVEPAVPVTNRGDLALTLDFAEGLPALLGMADGDLVTIRDQGGLAGTETKVTGAEMVDSVMFLSSGEEAALSWDLLLIMP